MSKTALHQRLECLGFLGEAEFAALDHLLERREAAREGEQVVIENQLLSDSRVLLDGWAFRYKSLSDGSRQILNFLTPGTIVGFFAILFERSDSGVEALTPLNMAVIPSTKLIAALTSSPALTLAMSWVAGQSERMLHEQITRIGRRNAAERIAHLFVELHVSLRQARADQETACALPLTQALIADALGMSHVHANRSFRKLVQERLVELRNGHVTLLNLKGLARRARFDPSYLAGTGVPDDTLAAIGAVQCR